MRNRYGKTLIASVLLSSLTVVGLESVAVAEPDRNADSVLQRVNSAAPSTAPSSDETALTLSPVADTVVGDSTENTTAIPSDPANEIELSSTAGGEASLKLTLPDLNLEDASVDSGATGAVFASDTVDVSVQAFEEGARIATTIYSASAPETFSYPVSVPAGGDVESTSDGMVVVTDSAGDPVGYFAIPWARDADGRTLQTNFLVDGDTVKQTVNHRVAGVSYPVVADPYLGKNLIKSTAWSWIPRNSTGSIGAGYTLRVTATDWAWKNSSQGYAGYSYTVGTYGWKELYKKRKNGGLNVNLDTMRDQFICHQEYALSYYGKKRPTWNLDEWRKDRSYWWTVRYACNPPAGGKWRY
ncbi:MAG: DUF2599 domain-containing protein [Kineosporiaceae bacterium]|nr:DUF2599 domain-containing protein [Aeromicrobium sp.]